MSKEILAALMTALLAPTSAAQEPPPSGVSLEQRIRAIPPGHAVEVSFHDGSKLRGWIGAVCDTGFALTHEQDKGLEKTQVNFDRVKSIKPVRSVKPSHTTRNILIGVGIALGAVAAIAGIGVAVAEK